MMYGLLNIFISGANSPAAPSNGEDELATCPGYLDPENEDRRDFEAKLDSKTSRRDRPN